MIQNMFIFTIPIVSVIAVFSFISVERRRREGLKLAGLIVAVVGLGLSVMLALLVPHEAVWSVGVIPLLIGLALMFHAYQTAPRTPIVESADRGGVS
ncbi:MAG: hypothetical protein JF614_22925 [Acidobacteria bacterium]|nr:hypothetical protein [Acidobacteriota bacterium]